MKDPHAATIGERIRDYRKSRGFTQADLAEAIGKSQQAIWSMEKGRTAASREDVRRIADTLRIPPADIEGGTEDAKVQARVLQIPLISWVSAGRLEDMGELAHIQRKPVETLTIADLPGGEYFATTVRGDSMDRLSPEGSIIIVNAADRSPRAGRCYLFSLRGEATYKRYQSDPVVFLEPFSTNPQNKPIFPKADKDWVVVGRVVRSYIDVT